MLKLSYKREKEEWTLGDPSQLFEMEFYDIDDELTVENLNRFLSFIGKKNIVVSLKNEESVQEEDFRSGAV